MKKKVQDVTGAGTEHDMQNLALEWSHGQSFIDLIRHWPQLVQVLCQSPAQVSLIRVKKVRENREREKKALDILENQDYDTE